MLAGAPNRKSEDVGSDFVPPNVSPVVLVGEAVDIEKIEVSGGLTGANTTKKCISRKT